MANQPINPMPTPPGMKPPGVKPVAPPTVPTAPGKGPAGPPLASKAGVKPPPGAKPAGSGQPGEEGDEEDNGPVVTFWQLPWVQNILPFVTSLSLHLALVVIAFLGIKAVQIITEPPHKEPPLVADADMVDEKQPGGVPFQGLGNDPLREAKQDEDPTSKTQGWAANKGPSVEISDQGGGSGDATSGAIQVGAGQSFGSGSGQGAGHGNGRGGGGEGGPQAMYGLPGGGGIGPKGPVFGAGGNARRIAFVCDASGSMINKMPVLKEQLTKAFLGLKPIQSFEMIFFQDQKFDSFIKYAHKDGLVAATPETKRKAADFLLGVTTTGSTDPIPGIIAAFKTKPQLMYLLTDGDFPDNDAVLKVVTDLEKALPPNEKVKINTIAFVGDGDNEVAFLDLLKKIAKDSGGSFRHVKESDVN